MAKKLTSSSNTNVESQKFVPLANIPGMPFKICIQRSLDNKFDFKSIKGGKVSDLHEFVENTVGKRLTISQVDSLYLRKRGLKKDMITAVVDGIKREILHYGRDRHTFRIHGFYSSDHFVVTKIDCEHSVHSG